MITQPRQLAKVIGSLCISLGLFLAFSGLALAQGPTITATDPVTNEVGVALTNTISLTFSQAISPATVNTGTIVSQGMMGGLISGTYSVSGQNVTLTPSRALFSNEIVRTTATSGTQNLSGDNAEPYQWQFTAGAVTNRCVAGFTDISAGLTGVDNSSVAWGDYDNDGDLDILLSGQDNGANLVAHVYRNDGGAFTDISAGLTGVWFSSLAWGDYDNDGDLDILLSGQDSVGNRVTEVYRNDGGVFSNISAGLTGVTASSVAWGDYDNDGHLDILLSGVDSGDNPVTRVYRNDGGAFTDISAGLTDVWFSSLAWGDYDNDGDLDVLLSGRDSVGISVTRLFRNDGGAFTNIITSLIGVRESSLAWGDYDNDGDLDVLLSGRSGGNPAARVYRNDGGAFINIFAGLTGVLDSSVAWGDYDNDGDLDILLSGADSGGNPVAQIYRNDGGAFINIFAGLTGVLDSSVAWGDYDNDGDLDILLSGTDSGGNPVARVYRNDDCPPPAVTATNPLTNEVGVALTSPISLTYSQAISPTTVNTGTIVAQGMMGGLISGTYSVSGQHVTLTPSRALFPNEIVHTTATSRTQDLKDINAIPYQWQFTAGAVTDRCVAGFTDISAGLTGVSRSSVAWGDYDNDGDLDFLLSGRSGGLSTLTRVYRNDGGAFTDIGAGLTGVFWNSVAWGRLR